jgi:hypothetical protein
VSQHRTELLIFIVFFYFNLLSCILIVMSLIFVCRLLCILYVYLLLLKYIKLRVPNLTNFQQLLNTSYICHVIESPESRMDLEVQKYVLHCITVCLRIAFEFSSGIGVWSCKWNFCNF